MTSPTQKAGYKAEDEAESYLISHGLTALERNVHFKTGELDLIMQDRDTLVFVEVRYRKNKRFGSPAETVTRSKQEKLIRSALLYCQKNNITSPWRIDVVAINDNPNSVAREISWIPSAVTA
ncbi:YraN family protein [Oceanospirillum sanctuarii]|uniref:YraN family protein n=1 Tax=Oceanospirillum sanctuarii TaxID=1434821 RepID=UPI000A3646CB|nr:YraN family protein [Oceanospirillum sanctuarii]